MAIQLGTRPISSYVDSRARKMLDEEVPIEQVLSGIWGRSLIARYEIGSQSHPGTVHTVRYVSAEEESDEDIVQCTCVAGRRGLLCSHAVLVLDDLGARPLPTRGGHDG